MLFFNIIILSTTKNVLYIFIDNEIYRSKKKKKKKKTFICISIHFLLL